MNTWQKVVVGGGAAAALVVVAILIFSRSDKSVVDIITREQVSQSNRVEVGSAGGQEVALPRQPLPEAPVAELEPASGQVAGATQKSGLSSYRNHAFDFELTYPESLGEATVDELTPDTPGICMKAGKQLYGEFSKNSHLDFAVTTPDFQPCTTTANPLFAIKSLSVAGGILRLDFGDFQPTLEVHLEATLVTATSGVVAYVFKNNVDKNSDGALAAVVSSPHPTLGHPVFRTHNINYEDGLKLLRQVIVP